METYKLAIVGQSADLKVSPTNSKDTGIFLPNDLMEFLGWRSGDLVSFRIFKEDCVKAAIEILTHLPLYSSKSGRVVTHNDVTEDWIAFSQMIENFFGAATSRIYSGSPFSISETTSERNYLYKLEQEGFNLRRFLVAGKSTLSFSKNEDNEIIVRFETSFNQNASGNLPAEQQGAFDTDASEEMILIQEALRTKPFLLLAGISGTGKSRIVRELAFKSCPKYLRDEDETTPGNYCMIEVKPNWHDSTELLGYYSQISKHYQFTRFVKFLVKAMMFPQVPFFVCMDEMNLAPVEQYFAEFLSILETRRKVGDYINTGSLVDCSYFSDYGLLGCKNNGEVYMKLFKTGLDNIAEEQAQSKSLIEKGLTLPDNVFIIGTVNMDDTTHLFSRKVLDRAMTIEMNGGKLENMFGQSHNLEYLPEDQVWPLSKFQSSYITADEVLEAHPNEADELKTQLPARLDAINAVLKDTPFVVSYRVLNELVIFAGVLLDDGKSVDEAIDEAVNQIVLMKILPRIEGDEDMFIIKGETENRLEQLMSLVSGATKDKLEEMNNRLNTGFTRFWP